MRKSHIHDYAVAAFRLYAKYGGLENYRKVIVEEAFEEQAKLEGKSAGIYCPTEAAMLRAEKKLEEVTATIEDFRAVERVIMNLERANDKRLYAFEIVYLSDPCVEFERLFIDEKVREASSELKVSERHVHRWLQETRKLFAFERGLRI